MNYWESVPLVGFDLESTSADPFEARICAFAFVLHTPPDRTLKADFKLVNPGIPIPPEATEIHGITDEMVKDEMPCGEAVKYIVHKIRRLSAQGTPLVGQNISYDLTLLDQLERRCGGQGLHAWSGPVLDTFVLDKKIDPFRPGSRRLSDLVGIYEVLGLWDGSAHHPLVDSATSLMVFRSMAERSKHIKFSDPNALHHNQVKWRREQQADLSAYFVGQGKEPIPTAHWDWPVMARDNSSERG